MHLNRARTILLILLSFLSGLPNQAAAQGSFAAEPIFAEANRFFHEAQSAADAQQEADLYRRALLRYEKLVDEGIENGKLYYNIGNTYYRLGDIGRAILNYKKAARFIPEDENLQNNLAFVQSQKKDKIEIQTSEKIFKTLLFWHDDLPFQLKVTLALAGWLFCWACICLRLYLRRTAVVWGLFISLILTALLGGSVGWDYLVDRRQEGVLVAVEVIARKGDGVSYQQSFQEPLHAGTDFMLLEKRGQWFYIALKDGRKCWVPAESAELV